MPAKLRDGRTIEFPYMLAAGIWFTGFVGVLFNFGGYYEIAAGIIGSSLHCLTAIVVSWYSYGPTQHEKRLPPTGLAFLVAGTIGYFIAHPATAARGFSGEAIGICVCVGFTLVLLVAFFWSIHRIIMLYILHLWNFTLKHRDDLDRIDKRLRSDQYSLKHYLIATTTLAVLFAMIRYLAEQERSLLPLFGILGAFCYWMILPYFSSLSTLSSETALAARWRFLLTSPFNFLQSFIITASVLAALEHFHFGLILGLFLFELLTMVWMQLFADYLYKHNFRMVSDRRGFGRPRDLPARLDENKPTAK